MYSIKGRENQNTFNFFSNLWDFYSKFGNNHEKELFIYHCQKVKGKRYNIKRKLTNSAILHDNISLKQINALKMIKLFL